MAVTDRRSGLGRLVALIVVVWLIIGVIAAAQRHYFSSARPSCAHVGTTVVAILAGPLNYMGANPKVNCKAPQPSK